jgi:hypothetical protein
VPCHIRAVADRLVFDAFVERALEPCLLPGNDRCYAFTDPIEEARASCTPKGRCRIGWIVANSGRESWDVWLDVQTGEGRLRQRTE